MTIQDKVWWLSLIGMTGVALAFAYVIGQAGRSGRQAEAQAQAYAMRRWFFGVLIALGIGVTGATLVPFPIPPQRAPSAAGQVVKVVGHQWAWQLDPGPIRTGERVEFQVSSADVNHGFGIYDPSGRLLAQTQAMPGYTNRLVHTFTKPGKYRILCLEYCGLVHHGMMFEFYVTDSTAAPS